MKPRYLIGIDPGVKTGLAVWDREKREFHVVGTYSIVKAMQIILLRKDVGLKVEIWFEDCRLRKWVDNRIGRERLQGIGSVKRDCSIWEEFCEFYNIPFSAIEPKNIQTKLDKVAFEKYTGWTNRTSEHARDAAMIVYGG